MFKYVIIFPVRLYKWIISPLIGRNCRYTPSCSTYMIEAVEEHGTIKGAQMGIKRLCRCHPFAQTHWIETQGFDPVPKKDKTNGD